ncbi:hypothetical protein Y1Q_0005289 [Alligator mississippiensis]|uniref:Uncharacterized protein n=1 Tax=Alligator mississippiensis TaxID=8496 RepID=A0A151MTA3_ALLMI|nr:hypothetical protein Y1Q_0005289 [Alligator mississippiensis]
MRKVNMKNTSKFVVNISKATKGHLTAFIQLKKGAGPGPYIKHRQEARGSSLPVAKEEGASSQKGWCISCSSNKSRHLLNSISTAVQGSSTERA